MSDFPELTQEQNKRLDDAYEKATKSCKKYQKEYQRFRRFIVKTDEYKTLVNEQKKLTRLVLEKKREIKNYAKNNLPEGLKDLKQKQSDDWKEFQTVHDEVWDKSG